MIPPLDSPEERAEKNPETPRRRRPPDDVANDEPAPSTPDNHEYVTPSKSAPVTEED